MFFKNLTTLLSCPKKKFSLKRLSLIPNYSLCKLSETWLNVKANFRFNLKNFFVIKKKVRKFNRKQKLIVWLFIRPNNFIKRKHKNTRMGKGVGKAKKLFFHFNPKTPLIILKYYSRARVHSFKKFLKNLFNTQFSSY